MVVEVDAGEIAVRRALREVANGKLPDAISLAALMRNLEREKYHPYLGHTLQCIDAASACIAVDGLPELAGEILRGSGGVRAR